MGPCKGWVAFETTCPQLRPLFHGCADFRSSSGALESGSSSRMHQPSQVVINWASIDKIVVISESIASNDLLET